MATRGVEMTLTFTAWDAGASEPKTGDSGNFTLRWVKDGTASAPTNSVAELDATNCPGIYTLVITSTEADATLGCLAGKSSTADVSLIPTMIQFERLPNAAPGAAGGLGTVDASNRIAGIQGTITDLDGLPTAADVWAVSTRTLSAFGFSVDVGTIESGDATTALETAATNSLASYDPPTKAEIDTAFDAVQGSGFDTATDSLEALRNRGDAAWITASGFNTTTPPTASAVADAVWDELQSGHTTSGTFGYYLDAQVSSAASPPTAAAIADAVWDELTSAHTVSGSYGKAIGDGISEWVTASGFSTFNASSDTVANVTTVGSVSGTVSADVVSVSGDSTAAANLESDYDGTGYSKTNSTIGTTTTNTDMRGTDSALLAASVPTNFGSLAITGAGKVTAGTVDDKAGYSISGTITTLDGLNNVSVADVWTTQLTESYATEGTAPTAAQALFLSQAMDGEKSISGTTVTLKKLDQSTTSATYTLDSSTAPTSITRAT